MMNECGNKQDAEGLAFVGREVGKNVTAGYVLFLYSDSDGYAIVPAWEDVRAILRCSGVMASRSASTAAGQPSYRLMTCALLSY
jgi:hypothetical protein